MHTVSSTQAHLSSDIMLLIRAPAVGMNTQVSFSISTLAALTGTCFTWSLGFTITIVGISVADCW